MPFEKTNPPANVSVGPACAHLRSKGMYITGSMNPETDDPDVGDGHCWCNMTQNVLGPDAQLVGREECSAARTCFRATIT